MKLTVAGLALGTLVAFPAFADVTDGPSHVRRVFDVMREGSKIGTDTFDVSRQGDKTTVRITTHILVKIAFITAYRYDHSETETWKGTQLISFKSTTDDNGTSHEIAATNSGGKILLTVDGEAAPASKAIAPASVWSADISKRTQLFDPGNGKRMAITAHDLGAETIRVNGAPQQLQHVKLSGQFARDLWFDEQGLVKMTLLGSDNSVVTSQLRQTTAAN